jgi:hypothetical protein
VCSQFMLTNDCVTFKINSVTMKHFFNCARDFLREYLFRTFLIIMNALDRNSAQSLKFISFQIVRKIALLCHLKNSKNFHFHFKEIISELHDSCKRCKLIQKRFSYDWKIIN